MSHVADPWIESLWQGKPVEVLRGDHQWQIGKVHATFFDDKGALHCGLYLRTVMGVWWTTADKLRVIDRQELEDLARNDSQCNLTWLL